MRYMVFDDYEGRDGLWTLDEELNYGGVEEHPIPIYIFNNIQTLVSTQYPDGYVVAIL